MRRAVAQFLRFLANERNASDLTIKAYREDLFGLIEWIEAARDQAPPPNALSPQELRAYQAALQEAGYARSTISRKLASLRSFYRFAMRQGITSENPAKPLRNPRRYILRSVRAFPENICVFSASLRSVPFSQSTPVFDLA